MFVTPAGKPFIGDVFPPRTRRSPRLVHAGPAHRRGVARSESRARLVDQADRLHAAVAGIVDRRPPRPRPTPAPWSTRCGRLSAPRDDDDRGGFSPRPSSPCRSTRTFFCAISRPRRPPAAGPTRSACSPPPWAPWPAAGCSTTWAAGSTGTPPMATGTSPLRKDVLRQRPTGFCLHRRLPRHGDVFETVARRTLGYARISACRAAASPRGRTPTSAVPVATRKRGAFISGPWTGSIPSGPERRPSPTPSACDPVSAPCPIPSEEFAGLNILFRASPGDFERAKNVVRSPRAVGVPRRTTKSSPSWNALAVARFRSGRGFGHGARRHLAFLRATLWDAPTRTLWRRWHGNPNAPSRIGRRLRFHRPRRCPGSQRHGRPCNSGRLLGLIAPAVYGRRPA